MLQKSERTNPTIDLSIDEKGGAASLKIFGILTESKANEIRKTVENTAGAVEYFKLNLENVTGVDISCIPALYATCESLGKSNKPVRLDGICPLEFTSAVEDVGYSYHRWLCFGR